MTRPKLKFAWIEKRKKRKDAYQQRMEKAEKLTTLCDRSDCLVFFSRDDDKLVVWPTRNEAKPLVELFYASPKDQEPHNKTNTKIITKVIEDLELDHLIYQLRNGQMLIGLSQTEIEDLISYVSKKIKDSARELGTEHPYTSVNDVEPESPMGSGSHVYKMDKWFLDDDGGDMETFKGESSKSGGADDA